VRSETSATCRFKEKKLTCRGVVMLAKEGKTFSTALRPPLFADKELKASFYMEENVRRKRV